MKTPALSTAGLVAAGVVAGAVLAGTVGAQAATTSPSTTSPSSTASAEDAHPGDNGGDGIPEEQEHHGAGHGLDLSGSVTQVGTASVTIKTATGTTTYAVSSASDIDKNGEASLSDLAAGDAVTFDVQPGTTTIDKLHAGDESKDRPAGAPSGSSSSSTASASPTA